MCCFFSGLAVSVKMICNVLRRRYCKLSILKGNTRKVNIRKMEREFLPGPGVIGQGVTVLN